MAGFFHVKDFGCLGKSGLQHAVNAWHYCLHDSNKLHTRTLTHTYCPSIGQPAVKVSVKSMSGKSGLVLSYYDCLFLQPCYSSQGFRQQDSGKL